MIKIMNTNGTSGPVLFCDICDARIEDIGLAAAVFPSSDAEGSLSNVMHVHKKSCLTSAEKNIRSTGLRSNWQELRHHFVYLLQNGGLSPEAFIESSVSAGAIGRVKF